MPETKWEYARVALYGTEYEGKDKRYWSIYIHFMGDIVTSQTVASLKSQDKEHAKAYPLNVDLWGLTIAKLGQASWELVMVQHPYVFGAGEQYGTPQTPNTSKGIAYFKRPVIEGRNVNTPAISIE